MHRYLVLLFLLVGSVTQAQYNVQTLNSSAFMSLQTKNNYQTYFNITLIGNVLGVNIDTAPNGAKIDFNICQDATGGRTWVWPSTFQNTSSITISTTASACTQAAFITPNGTTWNNAGAGGSGALPSLLTTIDAKSPAYGGSFDTKLVWDAAFTNGSATITCPNNDCNFVAADAGKIVYGTNPTTNFEAEGTVVVPQGTIIAVNGAQSITVSVAANATCAAAGNQGCVLVWGHDDSAALAAAWTAVVNGAPCAALILPTGIAMTQRGQFNANATKPGPCNSGSGNAWQGGAIYGAGKFSASMIVTTPNFDFTTCTGGISGTACFLGSASIYAADFSIFGGGIGVLAPHANRLVEFNGGSAVANAYGVNLTFTGWAALTTNTIGLSTNTSSMVGLWNVWVTGFGQISCQQDNNTAATNYTLFVGGACAGGSGTGAQPSGLNLNGQATWMSYGSIYGNGTSNASNAVRLSVSPSTFLSYGDQISEQQTANNENNLLIPSGLPNAYTLLSGDTIFNNGGNTGGVSSGINVSSGTVVLQGVRITLTGAGSLATAVASPGVIIDNGGNVATSVGATTAGSGAYYGLGGVLSIVFANLGTPANGTFTYCRDCTIANPCAGAGNGALAKRLNGVWVCN